MMMINCDTKFCFCILFSRFVLHSKAEEKSCGKNSVNSAFRIVGGSEAIAGHIPWIVSLVANERHFCGGSIISEEWLLTAAHCVNSSKISKFDVIAGSRDRKHKDSFAMPHKPHTIIVHPDYDNKTYSNDIALVSVRPYFKFRHSNKQRQRWIGAVCLANENEEFINRTVTISGFGRTSPNKTFASKLMAVNVYILDNKYCLKKFGKRNFVSRLKVCYGLPKGGKGSCKGDSGSPITVNENNRVKQIAIVAFGAKRCATSASVGTKIAFFRKWIRSNIGI